MQLLYLLFILVIVQLGHAKSNIENVNSEVSTSETTLNEDYEDSDAIDPLDCCRIEDFIQSTWRSECDFRLKWNDRDRLTIVNAAEPITTTTSASSLRNKDVKIVPISCDQQNCIFSKLNITFGGMVDKHAFSRLLDNLTNEHAEWTSAKARVVTKCLNKPLIGYEGECEINKILACTFDILTENCPDSVKNDPCKHASGKEGLICQISSSRYRPKHRRQFCSLPNLVSSRLRFDCGVNLIYKLEYVEPAVKTSRWTEVVNCKELSESTTCLLRKMDVLNKYGFIDHFRMKEYMATKQYPIGLQNAYMNTFNNGARYQNHCSSPRKLLNIIDSIISTRPVYDENNDKCKKLMRKIYSRYETQSEIAKDQNVFTTPLHTTVSPLNTNKPKVSEYKTNPMYNFGILGKSEPPSIQLLDLKSEKPLVLLPVYERMRVKDPLAINSLHNDGVFRS